MEETHMKVFYSTVAIAMISMFLLFFAGCEDTWHPEEPVGTYTITFDLNGGTGMVPPPIRVIAGEATPLPHSNVISKVGHVFVGWITIVGYGGIYNVGAYYTPPRDWTLYAEWEPETAYNLVPFTVIFDSNGGSAINSQIVVYNHDVRQPPDPVLDGYVFSGWYIERDFSGSPYNFSARVTANTTLYARWLR